jgi:hypothetical protein
MKLLILIPIFLFALLSCDRGAKTPDGLLKMFITDLSERTVDKAYFEENTTGELWESVKDLEEEEFKSFISSRKAQRPKLKIILKNCSGDICNITYEVKYLEGKETEKSKGFLSEVRKVAIVEKHDGMWKLSKVSNVKTYIEAKESLQIIPDN